MTAIVPTIATNRARLLAALRHIEDVPRFEWKFTVTHIERYCGTVGCAIGLAQHIGILPAPPGVTAYTLARALGLNGHDAWNIFMTKTNDDDIITSEFYTGRSFASVTPNMVADALEVVFARQAAGAVAPQKGE